MHFMFLMHSIECLPQNTLKKSEISLLEKNALVLINNKRCFIGSRVQHSYFSIYHQTQKNSPPSPPNELNSVTDEVKREAPSLYKVISIVAKKCPNYRRWQDAVSEFITLTTYARPEPHQSKTKVLIPLLYG